LWNCGWIDDIMVWRHKDITVIAIMMKDGNNWRRFVASSIILVDCGNKEELESMKK